MPSAWVLYAGPLELSLILAQWVELVELDDARSTVGGLTGDVELRLTPWAGGLHATTA